MLRFSITSIREEKVTQTLNQPSNQDLDHLNDL